MTSAQLVVVSKTGSQRPLHWTADPRWERALVAGSKSQDAFIHSADKSLKWSPATGLEILGGSKCRSKPDSHSACLVRDAGRRGVVIQCDKCRDSVML